MKRLVRVRTLNKAVFNRSMVSLPKSGIVMTGTVFSYEH